jgi:hypothetical protein
MEGGAWVVLIVSAVVGFFLMAAAIAIGVSAGTISAHKHIKRWEAREENHAENYSERKSHKPSELKANRIARATQAAQQYVETPAQTPSSKESSSKRVLLRTGDSAVLTHDVMIGEKLAFRKGQRVKVDAVKENAKNPQFKYAVESKELGSSFLLSDEQLMRFRPSTPNATKENE